MTEPEHPTSAQRPAAGDPEVAAPTPPEAEPHVAAPQAETNAAVPEAGLSAAPPDAQDSAAPFGDPPPAGSPASGPVASEPVAGAARRSERGWSGRPGWAWLGGVGAAGLALGILIGALGVGLVVAIGHHRGGHGPGPMGDRGDDRGFSRPDDRAPR